MSVIVDLLPVGGIMELPDVCDSSGRNYIALAGLAAVALVALGVGLWYARRRWPQVGIPDAARVST